MQTPWGELRVSDAHIHFFSFRFFSLLATQKASALGQRPETISSMLEGLGWDLPPHDPAELADIWVRELDRWGVHRTALLASLPEDHDSAFAAVEKYPHRFWGYLMINPTAPDAYTRVQRSLGRNMTHALCFFPAMHSYSLHDERVKAILELAASYPNTLIFVHCGVLKVGVRKKLGIPSFFDLRFSNPVDLHALALRYPYLNFVIPHFGAGYLREALMLCDLCPNVYLDTSSSNSWIRFLSGRLDLKGVFEQALEVAGPSRILFGTDSSYFPRGWNAAIFEQQAAILHELGVSREDAALIFGGNLERLHGG